METRVLLFDLDNTLWHFPVPVQDDVLHARCAEQIDPLLTDWGLGCDAGDLSRRLLAAVERARREAVAGSLLSPDWGEALDGALRDGGISLEPEQVDALWTAWQPDGARLGRQLYPDTVTTLDWARQAGYRLGLISNRWSDAAFLRRELDACHLGGVFGCLAVSSDVGWLKPHPEIYYAALRGLDAEPDETVMVGDSLRTDIAGAKMLGMRAVWKRNGRRNQPTDGPAISPDATIDDLWELRRLPFLLRDGDIVAESARLLRRDERFD
jgi:HAD superfamily hydrolase (TIGR01549 family)